MVADFHDVIGISIRESGINFVAVVAVVASRSHVTARDGTQKILVM